MKRRRFNGLALASAAVVTTQGMPRLAQAQSLLGAALMAQKRYAEAEPLMIAAASGLKPIPGVQERERAANLARLETLRQRSNRGAPLP